MLNRNVPLVVCLSVMSAAAFAQGNQGTGWVFEFANTASASGQFQGFVYNATSIGTPVFSNTGPTGAIQVVAKPDGSKFYVPGSGGLDSFDPAFTTPKTINGLTGTPTQAVITLDGRYLLVAASQGTGASNVYLLNTATDTVSLTLPVTGSIVGMVVSPDSTTAWILAQSSQTSILVVNLQNQTQSGTAPIILRDPLTGASLGGNATSFSMSPLGLLYVTASDSILEINPTNLQTCLKNPLTCSPVTTNIGVVATPGPLQFSSDGAQAYFVNTTPNIGGKALLRMSLPGHNVISWPPFVAGQQIEQFDSIVIASGSRLFAHSPGDTTLWDVAPDFSTVAVSSLASVAPATSVSGIVLSGELPSAHYLFLLVGSGTLASIYRVDLTSNTVTSQASAALGQGVLQFVYIPQETNPSAFIVPPGLTPQTVQPSTAAATLRAQVVDAIGNPVYAVPVSFTGDPSLTFSGASALTNAQGYVQANVTVGSTPGTYPVTLTAGSGGNTASTTYVLTIPGGPSQPGQGPSQITIVTGNGQLFQAAEPHFGNGTYSLQVQVTDAKGNPLQNANVTFTVTGPQIGSLDNPNAITDVNGLTGTDFFPGNPPQNTPFQSTTVTAAATDASGNSLGAVNFIETIFQTNPDGTGAPIATVQQPSGTQTITAGEGDVVPEAIVIAVFSGSFGESQPIPNVGLRIADATNPENNGPATCQGASTGGPLTDQTGTVHCALIASCSAGVGLHGFDISVGEYVVKTAYALNITPGASQTIAAVSSSNNQSGRPGAALALPLSALVTDQCGTAAQGIVVTWKVTQGSATLANNTTVSNQGGTVSNHVTLGNTPGTVTITASINSATVATFTATVQAVVSGITLVSGNNQTALLNAQFSAPLTFQLTDTSHNPVPGLAVTFSVAGGSASLNVPSATTNASGQVSVIVTAGNNPGAVTITASYTTYTASASLTVTAPGPGITANSFENAASLQAGLVPCGLAIVTGNGLATGVTGVVTGNTIQFGPLPYTLKGVSISVNGIPAPIQAVSNQNGIQQVNFQTPCEVTPGNGTVVVTVNSTTTTVQGVSIYPTQPGIITYAGPSSINYGWVISAVDGSTLTPSNLAHAGQTYYLVATGLGQTTPPATTNSAGTGTQTIPVANVILAINNIGVPVTSVTYLQGEVGAYIITFTIPLNLSNGSAFPTGVNFPIQLGVTAGGQTIYDNAPVALPGIH